MKKDQRTIAEFVSKLSDDDLRFVTTRLVEQYAGDVADALNCVSAYEEANHMLSLATSVEDFYRRCDVLKDGVIREVKRRNLQIGVAI